MTCGALRSASVRGQFACGSLKPEVCKKPVYVLRKSQRYESWFTKFVSSCPRIEKPLLSSEQIPGEHLGPGEDDRGSHCDVGGDLLREKVDCYLAGSRSVCGKQLKFGLEDPLLER